jgi:putative transposase
MTVSNKLIDQLLAGYKKPEDLLGENGLLKQLPSAWSSVPWRQR